MSTPPPPSFSYSSRWMSLAFEEAATALTEGEVPIGCVFIREDQVVAKARNDVNQTKNPTNPTDY